MTLCKSLVATAAIFAGTTLCAVAQTSMSPEMAASVPKQANGQLSTPHQDRGMRKMKRSDAMTAARSDVKADTRAARSHGDIPVGQQSTAAQARGSAKGDLSMTARSSVKAEAAAANKAGEIPNGQSTTVDQDKGHERK